MTDNVVDIPPAKFEEKYQGHLIRYTFIPSTRQWQWEFELHRDVIHLHNTATSRQAAIKAARKRIDELAKIAL